MKITRRQLRRIIREAVLNEALPPHLQKHFRKDGSSVHQPESEIKDVTPAGYGPEEHIDLYLDLGADGDFPTLNDGDSEKQWVLKAWCLETATKTSRAASEARF